MVPSGGVLNDASTPAAGLRSRRGGFCIVFASRQSPHIAAAPVRGIESPAFFVGDDLLTVMAASAGIHPPRPAWRRDSIARGRSRDG